MDFKTFANSVETTLLSLSSGDITPEDMTAGKEYIAQRARHLAAIINDPDFDQAVVAERDNVLIQLGIEAVDAANLVGQRVLGAVQALLILGANLLV